MGLQVNFNTGELTFAEAVGLARLLDSVAPGALQEASNTEIGTVTVRLTADTSDLTDAVAQFTPPAGPEVFTAPLADGAPSAAPVVPAVSPAPTIAPASHDSAGLPWDARIHASSRTTVANGTWRKKKNVPDETVAAVEAELRQAMAAPAATSALSPPPPAPVDQPVEPDVAQVPDAPAPPPAAPAPPPAAGLSGPQLFAAFMGKVSAAQAAGKVTSADVASISSGLGLASTGMLMHRPDLIPTAEAQINALIEAAG